MGLAPYLGDIRFVEKERHITGNLTANATNRYVVATPTHVCRLDAITVPRCSVETVPADADGTILATLRKYDASANAFVDLTDALSLEGLTTKESAAFVIKTGLDDDDITFEIGDVLYVDIVNNSAAIDTQPTNLAVSAMLLPIT
jgi:hypothetical protein